MKGVDFTGSFVFAVAGIETLFSLNFKKGTKCSPLDRRPLQAQQSNPRQLSTRSPESHNFSLYITYEAKLKLKSATRTTINVRCQCFGQRTIYNCPLRLNPRSFPNSDKIVDSNYIPWSVMITPRTPKRRIHSQRRTLAHDCTVMSFRGYASGHRGDGSMIVRQCF